MKRFRRFAAAVLVIAASVVIPTIQAQTASPQSHFKEHKSGAKITMKEARRTVLVQVPGGRIKSSELEKENGRLIYSFDVRVDKGITEVHVDAITGKVLEVKNESTANEAKERRQDRLERKRHQP